MSRKAHILQGYRSLADVANANFSRNRRLTRHEGAAWMTVFWFCVGAGFLRSGLHLCLYMNIMKPIVLILT